MTNKQLKTLLNFIQHGILKLLLKVGCGKYQTQMEKYSEAGLVYGSELKGQWIKLQDQLP
jgi:hypothetical protein